MAGAAIRMAGAADVLHPQPVFGEVRTGGCDRCRQIPTEAVAHIMGGRCTAKPAEVTGGAGRRREVCGGQCAVFRFPVPAIAHCRVSDTMRAFDINFPLWVIWPDMAVIAGFWFACLFQAEFMADVAGCTVTNRAIQIGHQPSHPDWVCRHHGRIRTRSA